MMTSVREAAANLQALHDALNTCGANYKQGYIDLDEYQVAMDRMAIDHAIALQRAQSSQDEMNAASEAYIKSEWAKNHPPETASEAWALLGSYYANGSLSLNRVTQTKSHPLKQERILPWQLSRDDMAELHLWWDWKQLPDDIKSELLPPPSPSAMTQAFMDTNPAWRFSPAGTLVASLTDSGRREVYDDERDWLGGLAFLIVAMTIIASLVIVIDHIVMG